jgi:phospho-N-acetylmuramoyl-pentapeptide-transferase
MLTFLGYGFLLPLLSSVILCRVMRRKLGWLKSSERKPGKEKIHRLFPRPRRPLSGGLAILISLSLGVLALNRPFNTLPLLFLGLVWFYGLIGFADDLRKTGGRGISEKEKLALQAIAGLLFASLLHNAIGTGGIQFGLLRVPFTSDTINLGWFYPILGMLVIVAASNAVNLTDGMDGLAGGQIIIAALFMGGVCYLQPKPFAGGIFLSMLAVCLGFLVFNYPPARLLMGDMGSLSLGAALGAGAMLAGAEALLPLVGAVFVINTLSVIVQVGAVRWLGWLIKFPRQKVTEPFRPFLITPLHHHFQWLNWPEKTILRLFWLTGVFFGALGLLSLVSGLAWLIGLLLLPAPLALAALQKLLRGSYFIGIVPIGEGPARLALFQGLPAEIFGLKLYRLTRQTSLSESALAPGTAEGLLWRTMSEIEARVAFGALFFQQHLTEEALAEWEEIPTRNLLLRESVVMQLARLYYSRDRLWEAIRLWEALPRTSMTSMPNLQEIVRGARLRLAELASKSYRQCMLILSRARNREFQDIAELSRSIILSRRFNQDLLELLLSTYPNIEANAPRLFRAAQSAKLPYRRAEKSLRDRINALDIALNWCEKAQDQTDFAQSSASASPEQIDEQMRDWLGFTAQELQKAVAKKVKAHGEITFFQPSAKSSRNAIARLRLRWIPEDAGPARLIAKSYREGRIAFFSACYRRERALLEMLSAYGCPVPKPYGGLLKQDRALLLMEDGGTETLAERLEQLDFGGRQNLLAAATATLADLHRKAHPHFQELKAETRKTDKDVLSAKYHMSAFRIALERIIGLLDESGNEHELDDILKHYQPVARLLSSRPETFIHFEFTPYHLLLDESRLTILDFEQGTIGPAEFDLACLLNSPEANLSAEEVSALMMDYQEKVNTALDVRTFDYASLAKSLTYAGAAINFYQKFGGDYHLQRMAWYLQHGLEALGRHTSLGPLNLLLSPWLKRALDKGAELMASPPPELEAPPAIAEAEILESAEAEEEQR